MNRYILLFATLLATLSQARFSHCEQATIDYHADHNKSYLVVKRFYNSDTIKG